MSKLALLRVGEGSFEQGFSVIFQLSDDGQRPYLEITGRLGAAPEIPQVYQTWQGIYRRLGLTSRITAPSGQVTNISYLDDCQQAAQLVRDRMNNWLQQEDFRPIRETWLEQLQIEQEIRVLLQTNDWQLQCLPWHLCDVFERYPYAEVALCAPIYKHSIYPHKHPRKKQILAILGHDQGIDIQADQKLLAQLPNTELTFLVKPQRQQLNDKLWEKNWDLLFFAGHSATEGDSGRIYLNDNESLTIPQLRYALTKAVENGLQLAIFNSCDGLGLARSLFDLNIPQVIVMREPVPDFVAQIFLKSFLELFTHGTSFYLAVRQAREKLQGLENQFPCASWLPVICQNPAVSPLSWSKAQHQVNTTKTNQIWTLPQTYLLLIGIALGYGCLIVWAGMGLLVILGGGAIALSMFLTWYRLLMSNNH